MKYVCPISDRQVDETVVRLVALLVLVATLAGCSAFLPWVAAALALDFFIRAFTRWPVSCLALAAKVIARAVGLPSKPINAGPKVFAARLGFVFAVLISALAFTQLKTLAIIVAGALAA